MEYEVFVDPVQAKAGVLAVTVTETCELGSRQIWCAVGDIIITAATKHAMEVGGKRPFRIAHKLPKEDRFCPLVKY
jgi:hypothetical protein